MFLYMLECPATGKVYIGATTLLMSTRLSLHRDAAILKERTTLLAQAIREHGWSAFEATVLAKAPDHSELMRMERQTIAALDTMTPNGYNMSSGGLGVPDLEHSEATKAKLSALRIGVVPWNKGKKTGPMSEATRAKQRAAHLGQKAWNKGIPASPETRLKLSALRMGGLNHKARPIEFDGRAYASIADATRTTGLSPMQLKYRLRVGLARYLDI